MIHPHYYHDYKADLKARKTVAMDETKRLSSLPPPLLANTVTREPKSYKDATKLFDQTFMKTGLRT